MHSTRFLDKSGRARAMAGTALYVIPCEMPKGEFVVKIGISEIPYQRFVTLLPGIPFPCVMRFTWIGGSALARRTEAELHSTFKSRNSAREWFLFGAHESDILWTTIRTQLVALRAPPPDWKTITTKQAYQFATQTRIKRAS